MLSADTQLLILNSKMHVVNTPRKKKQKQKYTEKIIHTYEPLDI